MSNFQNTDWSFYGNFGGSSGLLSGLFQPWQTSSAGLGQYLGNSTFLPTSQLPLTASGFLRQYVPELGAAQGLGGRLSQEVSDLYGTFRSGAGANDPAQLQQFLNQLTARPDVQGLVQQEELAGESGWLTGQVAGSVGLGDFITGALQNESSQLQNIYGGLGLNPEQIAADISSFAGGGRGGLGALAKQSLGLSGDLSNYQRQAVLAQLFGNQLVDVGGGRTFNPFSYENLTDQYQLGAGLSGDIGGTDILRVLGNVLGEQDLGINRGIAQAFQRSLAGGGAAYGGERGYRLTQGVAGLADILQEGQVLSQSATPWLGSHIDTWRSGGYGGGAGRGLPEQLAALARQLG
jgi:hypothetical protein